MISSASDAIIFQNHVHTERNIHLSCYKKQYSGLFNVLYVVSECQNSSQCSEIEYYQTFICPIHSFSQAHTVNIPCLCSVNNIKVLLYISCVLRSDINLSSEWWASRQWLVLNMPHRCVQVSRSQRNLSKLKAKILFASNGKAGKMCFLF